MCKYFGGLDCWCEVVVLRKWLCRSVLVAFYALFVM